jgi:predicted NAD/FAD-dependent oxidoreductase
MWDVNRRLGLCGDWLIGPRVEAAWMSGTALAERIGAPVQAATL